MTRRRWIVWLPALALLAAACGGEESIGGIASLQDGEAQAGSVTAAAEIDPEQAILDYAACMREHGVDMPDPQIDPVGGGFAFGITVEGPAEGGGPDDSAMQQMQQADEACRHFMEGIVSQFERPDMSEMQDTMLAFARCMREHGIEMPDPEFSADGGVTVFGAPGEGGQSFEMDPGDPAFQAAQEACREVFGGAGGMGVIGGGGIGAAGPSGPVLPPGGGVGPLPGTGD